MVRRSKLIFEKHQPKCRQPRTKIKVVVVLKVTINYLVPRTHYSLKEYFRLTVDQLFYAEECQFFIFIKIVHSCLAAQMKCCILVPRSHLLSCPFLSCMLLEICLNFRMVCGVSSASASPEYILYFRFAYCDLLYRIGRNSLSLWENYNFFSYDINFRQTLV